MAKDSLGVSSSAPSVAWYRALGAQYVRVQLLYNPLVTLVVVLGLGAGGAGPLWRSLASGWVVAAVTSSVCFVPVAVALAIGAARRARGRALAVRGHLFYLALALAALPLGAYCASRVTARTFGGAVPQTAYDYRLGALLAVLLGGAFLLWQLLGDARAATFTAELRAERAERHRLTAQLAALTAQLNPHLMFNALNTIASLVQSDPARAERTVLRLCDLYRGVLGATRREQHSLADELAICAAYLDVERARFEERLVSHVELEPGLDAASVRVPVLVLQPLVENAVTHGLADRARGGSVRIEARRENGMLELRVEDDGVGLGQSMHQGTGLGVETTRQRLALEYGERARFELRGSESGSTLAALALPLPAA